MSATDGIYFSSTRQYILSCNSIADKIIAIDKVIEALFLLMLEPEVIEKQYISEYSLDDGQTKIRAVYRGVDGITKTIASLNKMRIYYVNQQTGRRFRMVDGKNFTGNNY
jgi:hypothetical protein